ncbi:DUF4345 domain-containing protein [Saccharospirillum alexandrii]|uniref:DUF4345 domain-containing protein n=1 Tax=Saccharospirillum alexandrii TaxID=2448477 RepID=UPI000FDA8A0C|nr:DUF4345 domain-containing protein [Saccharospirillum alexandrii]
MKNVRLVQLTLMTAGALTGLIGLGILLMPDAFYASYGVTVPESASLRSELKTLGALLMLASCLMLAGVIKPSLQGTALIVAIGTYLALVAGRLLGLMVDGLPSTGILTAWAVEAALLVLVVIAGVIAKAQKTTLPLR